MQLSKFISVSAQGNQSKLRPLLFTVSAIALHTLDIWKMSGHVILVQFLKMNIYSSLIYLPFSTSFNVFPWTKGPGIGDEVTSEVMRFHERLVVEVRDYSVLDIATNIEHLKRET